jgi:diguanylate cyclase (GGDEF)-like protein/PAS domain S-box-containing protein/putative nucleotidyltransferase with HDIG domain
MSLPSDQFPHAVLALDADGRVHGANSAAHRLLERADLTGLPAAELLHVGPGELPERGRGRILRADGTPIPVDFAAQPAPDGTTVVLVLPLTRDQLVEETRSILDAALDNTPMGAALLNTAGEYIRVNPNLCRLLGRDAGGLLGRRDQEFTHPDDRQSDVDAAMRVLHGELDSWQTEKRFVRPDGSVVWAIANLSFLRDERGGPLCWVGKFQDITERKRVEERLRERERQLADAQRIAEVGSWEWDIVEGTVTWSAELCRLFGLPVAEMPASSDTYLSHVHPDDRDRVAEVLRAAGADGAPFQVEHRIVTPDGSVRALRCLGRVDTDERKRPVRMVGTAQDITERLRREAELERERRDLNAAQMVARIGSWDFDHVSERPGRWSLQLWRMLGLEPRAAAPAFDEFLSLVHPEDRDRVAEAIRSRRAAQQPYNGEFRMLTVDGNVLHVAMRTELARNEAGEVTGAFGTIQDITDRAERDAEQAALRQIAELVAENAPAAIVFASVANQVRELFGAHGGMVSRFEPAANRGVLVSGYSSGGLPMNTFTFALDGVSASAEVYRTGRPALFNEYPTDVADPAVPLMSASGITGGLAAPIYVAGELWGTLSAAFAGERPLPADAAARLGRFADLVAMAIANAEAWETLSRRAATDPMTGLANHRTFYERLRVEVQRARRYHRDLSVVLLDLDHFKAVNDEFGHQAGDRVLAEAAQRLLARARDGELVARIGGEEFAWLMPETDREGAFQAAERARRAIESEPFEPVGTLTISAGICAGGPDLDGEDLVRYADRALYWAKGSGRNTCFLYTADAQAMISGRHGPGRFQAISSVRALARAIDSKDLGTGLHSERVAALAERLALELGWTAKRAALLHACGLLHDVGKIGIPDEILLRPGPLSAQEYDQVKRHAELSAQIAAEVLEDEQVMWIRGHHERWDGSGYPDALAGEEIPDGAQLLALADAWDVMTESRTYKPAKSAAEAADDVRAQSGRQFAPAAVEALLALVGQDRRPDLSSVAQQDHAEAP